MVKVKVTPLELGVIREVCEQAIRQQAIPSALALELWVVREFFRRKYILLSFPKSTTMKLKESEAVAIFKMLLCLKVKKGDAHIARQALIASIHKQMPYLNG